MALSGSFSNHLAPGFRDIVGTSFKNMQSYYSKFFHVETSVRAYEDYLHATGIPMAVPRTEGEPTPFFDPFEGTTKRMTHDEWAIGVQISREAWDDDLYKAKSALRKAASSLARSMSERVEVQAVDIFNSGFANDNTAGTHNTIDGVSLFNRQHKKLIGRATYETTGSISNRLAGNSDILESSIGHAVNMFMNWTDDRGIRIIASPSTLITSTMNPASASTLPAAQVARRTLQSDRTPDGTNWAINTARGALAHETWPYLTDEDTWFVTGPDHKLVFLWRERPTFDSYDDKNTRTAKFSSFMRFSVAAIHYVGMVGTTGA